MDDMGSTLKKLVLAGIGACALTAEKSKELLDDMVEKGEITVEQGKALNKELKHSVKETIKDFKQEKEYDLDDFLNHLNDEQKQALKDKLNEQ